MDQSFKDNIYSLVDRIPKGKVSTYGTLASLSGHPGASRVVGQIAHFGPSELPWHRVVRSSGQMASGFVPGGPHRQELLLAEEGIEISNHKIHNLDNYLWKI